jgi:hypothetical protein
LYVSSLLIGMDTQNTLVVDILYVKWGMFCPARIVARSIYDKLDSNLKHLAEKIGVPRRDAERTRHPSTYPDIPDARVREFLKDFDDGTPGLEPLEIAAFDHIKLTANSDANIQKSKSRYN